ncbi:telomere-associated protein RIF1 isoform X3 [Dermacentor silvarum]|uniref:telomere-associated protein RIF1 isoform X3 n=1 Tax=Dermacentor silvarum TaxID=543639 RepID=UPI001898B960|nr:telomere-associated protein RIF1 isoform X3 [Dermacentor silvarum]
MLTAELVQQLKLSTTHQQKKLFGALLEAEAVTNMEEFRNVPVASSEVLLSGLVELLRSSKDATMLTRGADVLATVAQNKNFSSNVKCLQLWLRAAKCLVAKEEVSVDALRAIIQCLNVLTPGSATMSDWCQVGLQCVLHPEVRAEAYAALCGQRKAALTPPRRGVDAPAHVAIRDCIGPQLGQWMDDSQGCAALQVWTLIIQWMGEYLPRNAASVNVLLRVASKAFAASSRPELQRQALESWKALISTFKPETLRMNKMLNLVMTPLRQRPSADPLARLALVRTLWHLAITLGPQHLSPCFQQVGVTLLKTLVHFLTEANTVAETKHDHDNLRRECLYVLLRLLELPVEADWTTTMNCVPLPSLESPLDTGFLGRHLEICEPTCRAAIGFVQQCPDYAPDLGCLLMHLLLKRATEAHTADTVPTAAALLKLVLDGLSEWLLVAPLACKTILLEASQLPEKMLTSHCYYSGKLGLLHGTPVLSLLRLLLQPSLLAVYGSTDEVTQLFQRLLTLGLQNPSRLHLAQSVLSCLERCPPAAPLACALWMALASSLLNFLQSGQEVNQGSDLEPDFSALVAALTFPVHHALPDVGAKVRKAVTRKWLQLYQAFSCSAVLVPNVSPQGVCHEVWRRLCPGLNDQLKQDIGYVDAVSELLASAGSCLPSSQSATNGSSPSASVLSGSSGSSPRRWGLRPQRGSALGDLQPYCQALVWALDAVASHQLLPNESRQSVASIVGKLVRPVQDLLSSLRGMPALVEAVTLLGPALSSLLARGSGHTSKVEPVWMALCGALSSQCTAGPRDDSLLCALTPLLEAALGHSRGQVHDRAVHLWQSLFARCPGLHVPPRLRELLRKVKPSLVPDVEPEALAICEPASFSQDSLVPDACLPTTPQKKEALSFSPLVSSKNRWTPPSGSAGSTTRPTVVRIRTPQRATQSPRKRRSLYDFRADEFVEVVSPVKKKQVLTEHQKEVRKERRSLPALYSNLSQSGLDSQDSETPQESEDMDDAPSTCTKNQAARSVPVIVLDSDSDENGLQSEGPPSREVCHTPPLQEIHPPNTASGDVVPETQQDSAPWPTSVETPKGQKPCKVGSPSQPMAAGSPRVHRPKARLSFTRPSAPGQETCETLADTDMVPSSQSTIDSTDEVETVNSGQDKPVVDHTLQDPHPDSPVTVWLQDKERGRLVASQETPVSPAKSKRRKCRSLPASAQEDTGDNLKKNKKHSRGSLLASAPIRWQDEILEDGIAPLVDDDAEEPTDSLPAEQKLQESGEDDNTVNGHVEELCSTQESADTETYSCEEQLVDEREPVTKDVKIPPHCEPSVASPALVNSEASEECILRMSEGSSACYSESTECSIQAATSQASPEFGAPIPSSEDTDGVELAVDTEEQIVAQGCTEVELETSAPADDTSFVVCTVPETEDEGGVTMESSMPQTSTSSKPEDTLAQGKAVRGARKRKLPSQTTSPIASRLRAKQVRQEQAQQGSPPPPNGNGGKPPPRWSGSPAALSRSRIMLDAAMRNVGSSPSRHAANAPVAPQPADGVSAGPLPSILKRRPPTEEGSPQGSPQRAKVPSGRHVSFADPPVQGEYEIGPRKARFSRALYEEPEMDEGELADSQQPLWPSLEGCTEPVDAVLPLLTSSLWQRSLGRKLRLQGVTTVGALASMTCAKALQLPVRAPRVASLRKALEQYAAALQDGSPLNEASPLQDASSVTQSASLELPVHSE